MHPNDHPYDSDLLETDVEDWVTALHPALILADQFHGNLVNAALYVVRREALRSWIETSEKRISPGTSCRDFLSTRSVCLRIRSSEYIKDIGTPARLESVKADWKTERSEWGKSNRGAQRFFSIATGR